ncbi:MAG: glycosyltransferase, partial [Calditrichae bacterium]|nr:glycosyltransferase [Calditrichia bacterium]NIW78193.1 glycosyltransferase [Calditrichia bacterium]
MRSYSIIIAAHNEADNIANCLNSLVNQNYPKDQYEIIVAADRCEDNTVEVVNKFRPEFNHLHVIEVWNPPTGVSPKKFAINQALQHAQYEYFLFLDADVVPTKNHIRTMNQYFEKQIAAVISLMKFYPPKSFWQNFLVYEKLVSWCIAGAGVGFNRPIISYGGNWGYTKSAFNKVSGFENIRFSLSGDDDLLLQQMGKMKLPISFCLAREGWIRMEPPKSLSQFIRQRRRHFSAGKTYRFYLQGGYFLYHATNLALWLAWIFYLPAILLLI